ncbi:MAG: BTAD domain-containing putative transcriptional regulator [Anaerolineae bacterium]
MIRLLFLGTPRIEDKDTPIRLERRKALALLAYLAVSGEPITREAAASLFWTDHDSSRAFAYLRNTLWTISKEIGEGWLNAEGDQLQFNVNSGIELDTRQFAALLAKRDMESLTDAVDLYRGAFLNGFTLPDSPGFDNWQLFQQEYWQREADRAFHRLSDQQAAHGDFEKGIATCRRWIALDPLHEVAYRRLMLMYAWAGQQAAAVRQYRELARILESELGVAPDRESQSLYEAITSQRVPDPPTSATTTSTQESAAVTATESKPLPTPSISLPTPATPFVGRSQELSEIGRLLSDPACRLLTLVGSGGIGKTRLSIEAARHMVSFMPDGVYFISLAPISNSEFILPTIADSLGFCVAEQANYQESLLEFLGSKRMLLVLDNFEQLSDHAHVLSELLAGAAHIRFLVTSRERLNLQEEWLFELGGLTLPLSETPTLNNVESYSAVTLFVQAARRVRPNFKLSEQDIPHVVRICYAVEGMPLGIELAATWMQILSAREIAQEIENSLDFLTTSARNMPERHRSLRAVFERSWNYLTLEEQRTLGFLSVFRGGFTLDAARSVAGTSLSVLLNLSGKSLIRRAPFVEGRFEMHELLRQFADQKMSEAERTEAEGAHCVYFMQFMASQDSAIKGADIASAIKAIDAEKDNIRSAWFYAAEHHCIYLIHDALFTLEIYTDIRATLIEQIELLRSPLEKLSQNSEDESEQLVFGALLTLRALTMLGTNPLTEVMTTIKQAQAIFEQFPDHHWIGFPLLLAAGIYNLPGLPSDAPRRLADQAYKVFRAHNDEFGLALVALRRGYIEHAHIEYEVAEAYFDEALQRFTQLNSVWGVMQTRAAIAQQKYTLGEYHQAKELVNLIVPVLEAVGDRRLILSWAAAWSDEFDLNKMMEELRLTERNGDRGGVGWVSYNIGWLLYVEGRMDEASVYLDKAFQRLTEVESFEGMSWVRIYQAAVAVARGEYDKAETLAQEAIQIVRTVEMPWCIAGANYVLGDAALGRNDYEAAGAYYQEAVSIAHSVRSIMQTLRHLSGYADLLLHLNRFEDATELASFVESHQATHKDTLNRVHPILEAARADLSAEVFHDAQVRGRQLTLNHAIRKLLQDFNYLV